MIMEISVHFPNFLDAKAGDMVIGYESTPVKQVIAGLRISAEQDGENIYFEKLEELLALINFENYSYEDFMMSYKPVEDVLN